MYIYIYTHTLHRIRNITASTYKYTHCEIHGSSSECNEKARVPRLLVVDHALHYPGPKHTPASDWRRLSCQKPAPGIGRHFNRHVKMGTAIRAWWTRLNLVIQKTIPHWVKTTCLFLHASRLVCKDVYAPIPINSSFQRPVTSPCMYIYICIHIYIYHIYIYVHIYIYIYIPAEGKPRERFVCLLPGESQSPVIYNIKCSSELFGKLNFGQKKWMQNLLFFDKSGKHHVHQTWMLQTWMRSNISRSKRSQRS